MAPKEKAQPTRPCPQIYQMASTCHASLLGACTVVSSAVVFIIVTRQAWLKFAADTTLAVLFFTVATAWINNGLDAGDYTRLLTPGGRLISISSHRLLDACIHGMHFGWRPATAIGLVYGAACQLGPLSPKVSPALALWIVLVTLAGLFGVMATLDFCSGYQNPWATNTQIALYLHRCSLALLVVVATVGIVAVLAYRA